MKKLYAPWRSKYVKKNTQCPFCLDMHDGPSQEYILKRYTHVYVMLNLYPYNGGHMLVIPYAHINSIIDLDTETHTELMSAASDCVRVLTAIEKPDGFNIGLNMGGKAAGGSIAEHVHMHIVPRFFGDTSFLVTLADTKPLSQDLTTIYSELKEAFFNV